MCLSATFVCLQNTILDMQRKQCPHLFHGVVPHAVKHAGVCGKYVSVCWDLSVFDYQGHVTQMGVVVQLHDTVEHLDFSCGLLLLRRRLPPEDFY